MNKFEDYFWNLDKKAKVHKWHHYFKIYDKHFHKFVGKNPTILEIGIFEGGSLEMWNHYFDKNCQIYGVDVNPECLNIPSKLQTTNVQIDIGDQADRGFWKNYLKDKPKFDIIIDDGGHYMQQQIVTYEELYHHVSDDGVYLCEDLHTSYWNEYGGGLNNPNSFVEYSKKFIDMLHVYYIREEGGGEFSESADNIPNDYKPFRKITNSVTYYDSIIVLEKTVDEEVPKNSIR